MDRIIAEDVFLDSEPLELADELLDVEIPFDVCVTTDDAPEKGENVFFGIEIPIGDIAEVKGEVIETEKKDNDVFTVKLRVFAVDNRYKKAAIDFLSGKTEKEESNGKDGALWARALKQMNGTFASIINLPAGVIAAEQLKKVAEISARNAGIVKLTHAQRIIVLTSADNAREAEKELESTGLKVGVLHHGIRNIRGCCGALCRWSNGTNALELSKRIADTLFGKPSKFDVKIAVSDCTRNCSEAYCADIGLIAKQGKYTVYVAGSASSTHIKGLKLAQDIPQDDIIDIILKIIDWYNGAANERERMYKTLERLGRDEAAKNSVELSGIGNFFEEFDIDDNIEVRLQRLMERCCGLKIMRDELGV